MSAFPSPVSIVGPLAVPQSDPSRAHAGWSSLQGRYRPWLKMFEARGEPFEKPEVECAQFVRVVETNERFAFACVKCRCGRNEVRHKPDEQAIIKRPPRDAPAQDGNKPASEKATEFRHQGQRRFRKRWILACSYPGLNGPHHPELRHNLSPLPGRSGRLLTAPHNVSFRIK